MTTKKRIFISIAKEDIRCRDLFVGQKQLKDTPFDFMDMSVKEPWDEKWKTNCRSKIRGCDGVIALITRNTMAADGARWEMKCAAEEGIPTLGIQVYSSNKGTVPPELKGRVIDWTWNGISNFLDSL